MVPLARLELALPKKTDFESVASTNSATGACDHRSGLFGQAVRAGENRRRKLPIRPVSVNNPLRLATLGSAARFAGGQDGRYPAGTEDMMTDTTSPRGLIGTLELIAEQAPDEGLSLGEFVDALGEQAFGVILFAMALPVCIPFLYGVPQVMALPMMAISAQMAMGRPEPWLPTGFKARQIDKAGLMRMARGGRKWFGWLEALARPRLTGLSGPTAERIVGAVFVLFCASILVPLPMTNSTPGIALVIASLGLLTRDGLLVVAGLVLGVLWITLLITLFSLFGAAAVDVVKDFIRSLV